MLDSPELVDGAAYALRLLGPKAKDAVPELLAAYERDPRYQVGAALESIGDPRALDVLVERVVSGAGSPDSLFKMADLAMPRMIDVLVDRRTHTQRAREAVQVLMAAKARPAPALARLKAAVADELDSPSPRPENLDCEQAPSGIPFENCIPRAGVLLRAISHWGDRAKPALALAQRAYLGEDHATRLEARAVLAGLGDETIVEDLLRDLRASSHWMVQDHALHDLARMGSAARMLVPVLRQYLRRSDPSAQRDSALAALGKIGGDQALQILQDELRSNQGDKEAAARALGRIGSPAARTRSDLRAVARNHPRRAVRLAAASAFKRVTGKPLVPGRQRCPLDVRDGESGPIVLLKRGSIKFKWLPPETVRCSDARQRPGVDDAAAPPSSCLILVNRGEFVGAVRHQHGRGAVQHVADAYPIAFLTHAGKILLLEGSFHMAPSGGEVTRLVQRRGAWKRERFAELPGPPTAFRREGSDTVLLLVRERLSSAQSCGGELDPHFLVVRMDKAVDAVTRRDVDAKSCELRLDFGNELTSYAEPQLIAGFPCQRFGLEERCPCARSAIQLLVARAQVEQRAWRRLDPLASLELGASRLDRSPFHQILALAEETLRGRARFRRRFGRVHGAGRQ